MFFVVAFFFFFFYHARDNLYLGYKDESSREKNKLCINIVLFWESQRECEISSQFLNDYVLVCLCADPFSCQITSNNVG